MKEQIETALRLEPGVLALYALADKNYPEKIAILEICADEALIGVIPKRAISGNTNRNDPHGEIARTDRLNALVAPAGHPTGERPLTM